MNPVPYPLDYRRALALAIVARLKALEALRHSDEAARLNAALTRLRYGDFGTCGCCGSQIPYLEVAVDPTLCNCAACRN